MHDQGDARVAQCVDAGADRQLARLVECRNSVGREAELFGEIDLSGATGEFDHVGLAVDGLEVATTRLRLDQAGDLLVGDALAELHRDGVDELISGQQGGDLVVSEDSVATWQPEAGAGHDHGTAVGDGRRPGASTRWLGSVPTEDLVSLGEEVGEDVAQLRDDVTGCCSNFRFPLPASRFPSGRCLVALGCRLGCSGLRPSASGLGFRLRPHSVPCRIQPTQRLVERDDVAQLGVVGEQRGHGRVLAEHVLGQSLERLLGTHLDEHSAACLVQCLESLDELHGRCDLAAEDVDHLVGHIRPHRIELAVDVGDQRNGRGGQAEPSQQHPEGLARRGDDLGVEGVAHGQRHHLGAGFGQPSAGFFHSWGRSSDHGLLEAVDVGDHDVVVH